MNNELKTNDVPNKLLLILTYFFSMYILAIVIGTITFFTLRTLYPNNPNNKTLMLTLTNLLVYAIMSFIFIFILKNYYSNQFQAFKKKFAFFLAIAIASWICSLFLNVVIEQIMELLNFKSRASQNQEAIIESFKYPLLAIPMIIFGAPIVEETIFRGVIFNFARNLKLPYKINIILAFILSSTLFGLIHVFSAYLSTGDSSELLLGISYAAAGFVLTLVYYLTNNIFVPMLMHFIQNSFSVIIILLYPLLQTEPPTKIVYILAQLIHII
ncbi:CPBP family intramembrane metalloprotease [Mycoplasmatota bacterium]|nr:CPBP family intramembrane metalloprotease [Mycoplasmatota bacterium]